MTYNYVINATLKYNGTSDIAGPVSAEIIPQGVIEISYDDGELDTSVVAETNLQVAVHFVPDSYPVQFEAIKIYLDKETSTGTAAQFSVYADDGAAGEPGTRLTRVNKSGLIDGFNVMKRNGPRGVSVDDVVNMKYQILAKNMVAADTAAVKVFGIDVSRVNHIGIAEQMGVGTTNLDNLSIKRISV
jgi:hypothetical protein